MAANEWFEVMPAGHGVTIIREPLGDGDVKSYLVEGSRDVAVLDSGMAVGDFAGLVASLSDKQPIVLQSHAHWDHIGDSHRFERVLIHHAEANDLRSGARYEQYNHWFTPEFFAAHPPPPEFDPATAGIPGCEPTGYLNPGDRIDLGERVLEVFHTPGHSPGGITLLDRENRLLFPGDAVNFGEFFLHLEQSDVLEFRATLNLLVELAAEVDAIYPSHGAWPMHLADIVAARDAYEEILAGRTPDEQRAAYAGYPPHDFHVIGPFEFMVPAGYAASA